MATCTKVPQRFGNKVMDIALRHSEAGAMVVCLSFRPPTHFQCFINGRPSSQCIVHVYQRSVRASPTSDPLTQLFTHPSAENKSETGAPNAGHTIQQIWVFNAIQIAGFLFNGAILLTVLLSSNVRRTPTWFGLMASWMVFTLSNLLIVGHQIGPDPGFGICLTQAGFVYASPVL